MSDISRSCPSPNLCSSPPPALCSYTTVDHPVPSPHGAISFGKLTSMKIVDRYSCYAVGIKKCESSKPMLSKYENFGQFGTIASLRIIQRTNPVEVYIRFEQTDSAAAAIQWCRSRGMDADHGYNKYCIKFINNKTCRRLNCPNRHSWCYDECDIMTKHKLQTATPCGSDAPSTSPAFKNFTSKQSVMSHHMNTPRTPGRNGFNEIPPRRRGLNMDQGTTQQQAVPINVNVNSDEALRLLQCQFTRLQQQMDAQNRFIRELVKSHQKLKEENLQLKSIRSKYGPYVANIPSTPYDYVVTRGAMTSMPRTDGTVSSQTGSTVTSNGQQLDTSNGQQQLDSTLIVPPLDLEDCFIPPPPPEGLSCADIVDEVIREGAHTMSAMSAMGTVTDCGLPVNAPIFVPFQPSYVQ